MQRPTAKELLKHRFIKTAKKTSHLVELIDRFTRWKQTSKEEEGSSSDDEAG